MLIAYVDGSCVNNNSLRDKRRASGSYCIEKDEVSICSYSFFLDDANTSNEAEYMSLINLLEDNRLQEGTDIRTDSKLLEGQLMNGWKVKARNLKRLYENAKELVEKKKVTITWIPRHKIFEKLGH